MYSSTASPGKPQNLLFGIWGVFGWYVTGGVVVMDEEALENDAFWAVF
jgi:hypothetical protein